MNDVVVQNGTNNGHANINQNDDDNSTNEQKNEIPITIATILITAVKITALFFWYIIKSFFEIFHKKKKSIRNETVLITGSAGYLGINILLN
jgi:hypothetical protein